VRRTQEEYDDVDFDIPGLSESPSPRYRLRDLSFNETEVTEAALEAFVGSRNVLVETGLGNSVVSRRRGKGGCGGISYRGVRGVGSWLVECDVKYVESMLEVTEVRGLSSGGSLLFFFCSLAWAA
jgi:hypothetical protein